MARKYLDDLKVDLERVPQSWSKGDRREDKWAEERSIYGFDSRETWSVDCTFFCWLYERLMMYNEINIVDTSYHKYEFEGETLTFQDCIDKMLVGCRVFLTDANWDYSKEKKSVEDVPKLFALCFWSLWW